MKTIDNKEKKVSDVLGQKISAPQIYDKSILVREERFTNRKKYNIDEKVQKFVGFDVWNCYEISYLDKFGKPEVSIGKMIYPSISKYIVESKSLKLYLNSFNNMRFNDNNEVENIISKDLSSLLETKVEFYICSVNQYDTQLAIDSKFENYDSYDLEIPDDNYTETPNLLEFGNSKSFSFYTDLLRSNCKITSQPDWGTCFISMNCKGADISSILKYIISFRNECHFHEEVCEMIYTRLFEKYNPEDLFVGAFYTRRGGIDINPVRASSYDFMNMNVNKNFLSKNNFTKMARQ